MADLLLCTVTEGRPTNFDQQVLASATWRKSNYTHDKRTPQRPTVCVHVPYPPPIPPPPHLPPQKKREKDLPSIVTTIAGESNTLSIM